MSICSRTGKPERGQILPCGRFIVVRRPPGRGIEWSTSKEPAASHTSVSIAILSRQSLFKCLRRPLNLERDLRRSFHCQYVRPPLRRAGFRLPFPANPTTCIEHHRFAGEVFWAFSTGRARTHGLVREVPRTQLARPGIPWRRAARHPNREVWLSTQASNQLPVRVREKGGDPELASDDCR